MLSDFVTAHRDEIIKRCRAKVAARAAPRATQVELEYGIPLFLDQLAAALRTHTGPTVADVDTTAAQHGGELLRGGFTIAQVVHDYGDACQAITGLAIELAAPIATEEFRALNQCLDDAIAGAATEYGRQRDLLVAAEATERATEDLGILAHELRNLLATASLAFEVLSGGSVGITGSTGQVLGRCLIGLRDLVDRSLAVVRLKAGIESGERIVIGTLLEEVELTAMMAARAGGHELSVDTRDGRAVVIGDPQILASILANLLQNAFKHSPAGSHVALRSSATRDRVVIEVEDQCGGLPAGALETLFEPFAQRGVDRSGLGLGLVICRRGVEALGGAIRVHDRPGHGCTFTIELPRVADDTAAETPRDSTTR
jgi:signal transduction histidine kinase